MLKWLHFLRGKYILTIFGKLPKLRPSTAQRVPSQLHSYVPMYLLFPFFLTVAVRMLFTSMSTEIWIFLLYFHIVYFFTVILGYRRLSAVEWCFVTNAPAGLRPEQQRLLLGSKDLDDYARLSTYSTQRSISLVLVECLERSRGSHLGGKWDPSCRV